MTAGAAAVCPPSGNVCTQNPSQNAIDVSAFRLEELRGPATIGRMRCSDTAVGLPALIDEKLGLDDDPNLWVEILRAAADDAAVLCKPIGSRLYAIVGCCSHWARPHQSRWTAAGGFALPQGYGDGEGFLGGLPNLDWSVRLQFNPDEPRWDCPIQAPTKRFSSVRLAIPSRTARHLQAAVHSVWSRATLDEKHKRTVFYGFRKSESGWKLVARTELGEGQNTGISHPPG